MISVSFKNDPYKVKKDVQVKKRSSGKLIFLVYLSQWTPCSVSFAGSTVSWINHQSLFVKGSGGFRKSTAVTHFTSEMHLSAFKLDKKENVAEKKKCTKKKWALLIQAKLELG